MATITAIALVTGFLLCVAGLPTPDPGTLPTRRVAHSVIFEPQREVKLTRSSYQLTTYIDFQPFLLGFYKVRRNIEDFLTAVRLPLFAVFKLRDKMEAEGEYLLKAFSSIQAKFYDAIDHLPPSGDESQGREKRSTYELPPRTLTREEIVLVDTFMELLKPINPKLHHHLRRQKRFGIMTFLLGWGVYSNSRSIKKIKENVNLLRDQNVLQDKQIKTLASFLNLTMTKVNQHDNILYDLTMKFTYLNQSMRRLATILEVVQGNVGFLSQAVLRINRVNTAMHALKEDVDSIYEYMRVMATRKLNPLIIPPSILRQILAQTQEDIKAHPRLHLTNDPGKDIWTFYSLIRITPIIQSNLLVVVLTIPLKDESLEVDLYRVYNLPMLHPELGVQATYELEGRYLAILMHGLYVTIPHETEIKICMASEGNLCMLDQALYPVERVDWCIYALFKNDLPKIQKFCKISTQLVITDQAMSLDGYLWAISVLETTKIQIHCLQENFVRTIHPPVHILDVGHGCEAFTPTLYIPAQTSLTTTLQSLNRSTFFLDYNQEIEPFAKFAVWEKITFEKLTPTQVAKIKEMFQELPPLPMGIFNQKLSNIDTNYPTTIPEGVLLGALVIGGIALVASLTGGAFLCFRYRGLLSTVFKLAKNLPTDFNGDLSSLAGLLQQAGAQPPPKPRRRPTAPPALEEALVPQTAGTLENPEPENVPLDLIKQAARELHQEGSVDLRRYSKFLTRTTPGASRLTSINEEK